MPFLFYLLIVVVVIVWLKATREHVNDFNGVLLNAGYLEREELQHLREKEV